MIEPQMAALRIPPRFHLSYLLIQSAFKSPFSFSPSHSHTPSHSCGCCWGGRTSARAMSSSSSSSEASSPAPYTTLAERATFEREIKKSKFIAIASSVSDERSAMSFLSQVKDPRATHNCWAYKLGEQYRSNDDGEPSGTAGKPMYSAIVSSGLDMVMVVVIRYFGGIKLGTGGLVRAYGGVTLECLKSAPTCYVKPKVRVGMEVPFELVGTIYHQLQHFHAEDIKQDYDTGNDGTTMVTFKVDYEKVKNLEDAINSSCGRKIELFKG